MGLINGIKKLFARKPRFDTILEPFAVKFHTDKSGETDNREVYTGSYGLRILVDDERCYDVLDVGGYKDDNNLTIIEGDNGIKTITIKRPTLGWQVEPNSPLDLDRCRCPGLNDIPEVKFTIYIKMPQHTPVTQFAKWWNVLFRGRALVGGDVDIYLTNENHLGEEIRVYNRPLTVNIPGIPPTTIPRLRVVDGRKGRSAFDTLQRDLALDMQVTGMMNWEMLKDTFTNRGYLICAMFTNEELEHIEKGTYDVNIKITYGEVRQHFAIGKIRFEEGVPANITLKFERQRPARTPGIHENTDIHDNKIRADGVDFAQYVVDASYNDGNVGRKPDGMELTIDTVLNGISNTAFAPLPAGASRGMAGLTPGNVFRTVLRMGKTPPFLVPSCLATGQIALTARMLHAQPAETHIEVVGHKIELIGTPRQVTVESHMRMKLTVKVVDLINDSPINWNGRGAGVPGPELHFSTETHTAKFVAHGGAAAAAANPLAINVREDGTAEVDLIPGDETGEIAVTVTMDHRVKEPLNFQVQLKPIELEWTDNKDLKIVTNMDESRSLQFGVQAKRTDGGSEGKVPNAEITVSIENIDEKRTEEGQVYPYIYDVNAPAVKAQTIKVKTNDDGVAHIGFVSGEIAREEVKITAQTLSAKSISRTIKIIHPVVRIINVFSEHEGDMLNMHQPRGTTLRNPPAPPPNFGFTIGGNAKFGFMKYKRYLIQASVEAPGDDTNVVPDGIEVMFSFQREKDIGEFKLHSQDYPFVGTEQPNQKHVKVKDGIAKVEYVVESLDPLERFFAIYAKLPFSKNQDQVLIPIIQYGTPTVPPDPEEPIPGYGQPKVNQVLELLGETKTNKIASLTVGPSRISAAPLGVKLHQICSPRIKDLRANATLFTEWELRAMSKEGPKLVASLEKDSHPMFSQIFRSIIFNRTNSKSRDVYEATHPKGHLLDKDKYLTYINGWSTQTEGEKSWIFELNANEKLLQNLDKPILFELKVRTYAIDFSHLINLDRVPSLEFNQFMILFIKYCMWNKPHIEKAKHVLEIDWNETIEQIAIEGKLKGLLSTQFVGDAYSKPITEIINAARKARTVPSKFYEEWRGTKEKELADEAIVYFIIRKERTATIEVNDGNVESKFNSRDSTEFFLLEDLDGKKEDAEIREVDKVLEKIDNDIKNFMKGKKKEEMLKWHKKKDADALEKLAKEIEELSAKHKEFFQDPKVKAVYEDGIKTLKETAKMYKDGHTSEKMNKDKLGTLMEEILWIEKTVKYLNNLKRKK
ncbi:hypothetical protein JXB28_05525 [Candidatus Woesearchaeota archaeon]|nr:hypothetical protein [Candidatus Woesearchaeota archaeon]